MKIGRQIRMSSWFGALLLASACGGGGGGDVGVEDLGDELSKTFCDIQTDCGEYPDRAACLEANAFQVDQLAADVEAGIIIYDSAKARECLDSLSNLFGKDCSLFPAGPSDDSACEATFEGTIALGEACLTDESCAGLAFCSGNDAETCSQGVCVADEPGLAEATEGQSCANVDCAFGLFCNESDVCAALAAPGEACADFFACEAGYICDLGPDFSPGTCVEMPDTGDTCDPEFGGEFLGGQLSCLRTTDFCDPADTTCKTKLSPGSTCGPALHCVNYTECEAGTCVAKPGLGDACVVDAELQCLGDLDCENGVCVGEPIEEVCTF